MHGSTSSDDGHQQAIDVIQHPTTSLSTQRDPVENFDSPSLMEAAIRSIEEDIKDREQKCGIKRDQNGLTIEDD